MRKMSIIFICQERKSKLGLGHIRKDKQEAVLCNWEMTKSQSRGVRVQKVIQNSLDIRTVLFITWFSDLGVPEILSQDP